MNVCLRFPHSVGHNDLDSISRLTFLVHIRVVPIANARVLFLIVIEVSISKG